MTKDSTRITFFAKRRAMMLHWDGCRDAKNTVALVERVSVSQVWICS